jgi:hypothetical protein
MHAASDVTRPATFLPPFRLPLRRFVFGGDGQQTPASARVIYASDEADAQRILESGL